MAFFRKVVLRHDTGLGEAYMDGDYEVCIGSSTCAFVEAAGLGCRMVSGTLSLADAEDSG